MSLRIVRGVTSNRSASSAPVHAGRVCSNASNDSNRDDVSSMPKIPPLNRNLMFLYGSYGKAMNNNESIRSFSVDIAHADLDDLLARLARTRLPEPAPGDDWDYGTPNHYLREMVDHWQNGFDWREQEARMNEFPHYLTEIDGQTVHFIHVPSAVEGATPLLLVHT